MPTNNPYPSYATEFDEAIAGFWNARAGQADKQLAKGTPDAGTRGTVTGGQHLGPIEDLIISILGESGFPPETISKGRRATLPGFYRERKSWDIVVLHGESLVATIELKSHVGSFGNNQNNRIEEAIGQTDDFWMAYEHGVVEGIRPWFGYLMIVEDSEESRRSRKPRSSSALLPLDPAFIGASYLDRYSLAFERLVETGKLDSACLAASRFGSDSADFPNLSLTFDRFAQSIMERCEHVISELGEPPVDEKLF